VQQGDAASQQNGLYADNRLRHHVRSTLCQHREVIMFLGRSSEEEIQKNYTDNSRNDSARNSLDFCPASSSFAGQYSPAAADGYRMGYRATTAGLQSDTEQVHRAHTWKLH